VATRDPVQEQLRALGEMIRSQRQLANLSLRQLAESAKVSNPYLSQIERGLHEPSLRVLVGIAEALGMPVETFLAEAGFVREEYVAEGMVRLGTIEATEQAIKADPVLGPEQKDALLTVYRTYVEQRRPDRRR
jgi:transcriptional regulator with XRE-family HTH domain